MPFFEKKFHQNTCTQNFNFCENYPNISKIFPKITRMSSKYFHKIGPLVSQCCQKSCLFTINFRKMQHLIIRKKRFSRKISCIFESNVRETAKTEIYVLNLLASLGDMYLLCREKKELDIRKQGGKVAVSVKGGEAKLRRHQKNWLSMQ